MITPLRRVRERRGETLTQVANALGVNQGNLSRIERGVHPPSKQLAIRLARHFRGEITEDQIIFPERYGEGAGA